MGSSAGGVEAVPFAPMWFPDGVVALAKVP